MTQTARPTSSTAHRALPCTTLLLAMLIAVPAAHATDLVPLPVGSVVPLAVNSYDAGQDVFDANYEVHLLPPDAREMLAVWVRWADVNGSQNEVVGRLFDADGQPAGPRFQVNASSQGWQQNPAVARNGQRVLVAWRSHVGSSNTIHARLLDARGETMTPDVQVGESGNPPAVALAPSGRGLVLWTSFAGNGSSVHARPLSEQGALGGELAVTASPPGSQKSNPAAGADGAGSFLIVWRSYGQVGPGAGIFGRWFGSSGIPLGSEVQIHQQEIPSLGTPQVAVAPDGSAVVVWDVCDFSAPSFPCEVRARAYGADRLPLGPEMRVSPLDGLYHENAAVAFDDRGDWAVSFESCRSDNGQNRYDCRVTTAFFAPDGSPLGDPQSVSMDGRPVYPSVAPTADGFLVGWDIVSCDAAGCGSDPEGIYMQRYALRAPDEIPPPPPPGDFLASNELPGFRVWVRIGGADSTTPVRSEADCIPETLCVSGAVPGRSELFVRIVGPKPNGFLWPTLVKFTTAEVEVWIEQVSTGELQYYRLTGASAGSSELPGLFDRMGFES